MDDSRLDELTKVLASTTSRQALKAADAVLVLAGMQKDSAKPAAS